MDQVYYREAFAFIRSKPLAWLRLEGRKAFFTIVPVGASYRLHSPLYFYTSVVSYLCILPFGLAGLPTLIRQPRADGRLLGLLAASAVAICLIFFPQERFRIPIIDPTLIVAAASRIAPRA
jgi:hypothetical protein